MPRHSVSSPSTPSQVAATSIAAVIAVTILHSTDESPEDRLLDILEQSGDVEVLDADEAMEELDACHLHRPSRNDNSLGMTGRHAFRAPCEHNHAGGPAMKGSGQHAKTDSACRHARRWAHIQTGIDNAAARVWTEMISGPKPCIATQLARQCKAGCGCGRGTDRRYDSKGQRSNCCTPTITRQKGNSRIFAYREDEGHGIALNS